VLIAKWFLTYYLNVFLHCPAFDEIGTVAIIDDQRFIIWPFIPPAPIPLSAKTELVGNIFSQFFVTT
jgi:hypothetical protein